MKVFFSLKNKNNFYLRRLSKISITGILGFLLTASFPDSKLKSLIFEGNQLHSSLKTRHIDTSIQHFPPGVLPPGNPYISDDSSFVEIIARSGSQGRLGREGIRYALYALYFSENELGFYGLEAKSIAEARQREKALRKIWVKNISLERAYIHREGSVVILLWNDGVSSECWEAVKSSVTKRLSLRKK